MKSLRRLTLIALLLTLLTRPGNGCSFDPDEAAFSRGGDPDRPYANFVAGRLGLVDGGLRIRHLVVAYNTLSGRGLSPAEQKAAVDVDRFYEPEAYDTSADANRQADDSTGVGRTRWNGLGMSLNAQLPAVAATEVEREVPGETYESFTNCLDDAFTSASNTLEDRLKRFGNAGKLTPDVVNWLLGQQDVFANCGRATTYTNPPPPPLQTRIPHPAAANAPLWLKQDRAYQTAAAHFYALEYDAALAGFRAIASDKASPWSTLAPYLEARTMIRQAEVPYTSSGAPDTNAAASSATLAGLAHARDQLQAVLHDPTLASTHAPAAHLLDYVMARLDPEAQADTLATRLTAPRSLQADATYRQNMIDLSFVYRELPPYTVASFPTHPQAKPRNPMLRWVDDLYGHQGPTDTTGLDRLYSMSRDETERRQDALAQWRTTHAPQWLVAAMALAKASDPALPELTAAALPIPPTSPTYASATYRRLTFAATAARRAGVQTDPNTALYTEVSSLLPSIERTQSRSTINAFADIRSSLAPTLDAFLKTAPRLEVPSTETPEANSNPPGGTPITLCGVPLTGPATQHLDTLTATIVNERMPLALLREAALASTLPPNLRFELAHVAWTRAILLDGPDTARALSPTLAACYPSFKPWLADYDAAATPDARHVLGLLALMRFPSTEPIVRIGYQRDFAAYDDMRDNWWCVDNAAAQDYTSTPPKILAPGHLLATLIPRTTQPDPPFLTPQARTQADTQIAALQKIPASSDYFAQQAIDWVKAHPDDPHNPDVLGFASRVVRNACRTNFTVQLNHQLFDLLHQRYPKSDWAKKYTTWE